LYPASAYHTVLTGLPAASDLSELAKRLFAQTVRFDFQKPGFSLVTFSTSVSSTDLRRCMVSLKQELSRQFFEHDGRRLVYRSMARFDQQVTTKFHRDGGPDESFLMLGYEPSDVPSMLALADYTRAAHELKIDPKSFERDHNPMYRAGEERLGGYITRLEVFDPSQANILFINNSCLPFREDRTQSLGVMHQATIPNPDSSMHRIINSTMLRTAANLEDEEVAKELQAEYITTTRVSGSNYGS
jgi:hypothetical protein